MNSLTFKCGLVSFKCVTTETARTKNPACPLKISLLNRWKMCCTMQPKYLWGTLSEPVTMDNESSALQFNYFPWLHKFCFFSKSRMKNVFILDFASRISCISGYVWIHVMTIKVKTQNWKPLWNTLKNSSDEKEGISLDFCSRACRPCLFWCPWKKYCLPTAYK